MLSHRVKLRLTKNFEIWSTRFSHIQNSEHLLFFQNFYLKHNLEMLTESEFLSVGIYKSVSIIGF